MQAIAKIKQRQEEKVNCHPDYSLILMDIDMPVMNGYETTQEIIDYYA